MWGGSKVPPNTPMRRGSGCSTAGKPRGNPEDDVPEGGETSFLNQRRRVNPKAGSVCLFPAAFPWVHRGEPPLSGVKYIATGWWYHYQSA